MEIKSKPKDILYNSFKQLKEQDIFLPELYFITQSDAFPGAILPEKLNTFKEIYHGKSITPILPIRTLLLEHISCKEIETYLKISYLGTKIEPKIKFELDFPLVEKNTSLSHRLTKIYTLKKENALAEVPVLEVWPNFQSETWKEFYAFYYNPDLDTFQVKFAEAQETHSFKGVGSFDYPNYSFPDTESNCQIARLTDFPSFIECCKNNHESMGIILLKAPRTVGNTTKIPWRVGVDFTSSFTNVYINHNGTIEPLKFESLHFKVTESSGEIRQSGLYEYFIASTMELPLQTVLTTRGSKSETLPVLDGRIYIPRDSTTFFKPTVDDWIYQNLKWSSESLNYNYLFLSHLILQVAAQAVFNNAMQIQWLLAYPSTFSKGDQINYIRIWESLINESYKNSGIEQKCPGLKDLRQYCSRTMAVAYFFSDHEIPGLKQKLNFVNATCLYIDDHFSDISIWENNCLIHQCSIDASEKDFFSQYIQMNPGFLERMFKIKIDEWQKLQGFEFYLKLDIFMRRESDGWLKHRRCMINKDPEFQGLLQLMALGFSGLYYYLGLILKALSIENKYKISEIAPVFIGGDGSRLLHWFADGGEFKQNCKINNLFSAMMSCASGFEDTKESTTLSPIPQAEVACGLVLGDSHLKGLDKRDEDPLIAGEAFSINGEPQDWNARMRLSGTIEDFEVPELTALKHFMDSYHRTLEAQRVEGIDPFKGYVVSDDADANAELWRTTARELKKSLLRLRGNVDDIRVEPPFILALKALLQVLGKRWADEWK